MALMLAIWSPHPNWIPKKPKLIFQICQKESAGRRVAVDEVLVMSVHPGFGGQKYLSSVEEKVAEIRRMADWGDIAIDGGIDGDTVIPAAAAGCNLFVAGSYLYKQDDMAAAITDLRRKAADNFCKNI